MNERVPLAWLLPLRFLVAAMLLIEGFQKLAGGWLHGDALHQVTGTWLAAHRPYPFFLAFVNTAHAHPKIFAFLITVGELFIGACLAVGVVSRLASGLGVVLLASIAAASGQGLAPPGNAVLMAAILGTFVLAPPGRTLGIDARLRGRLPGWMI